MTNMFSGENITSLKSMTKLWRKGYLKIGANSELPSDEEKGYLKIGANSEFPTNEEKGYLKIGANSELPSDEEKG